MRIEVDKDTQLLIKYEPDKVEITEEDLVPEITAIEVQLRLSRKAQVHKRITCDNDYTKIHLLNRKIVWPPDNK